MTVEHLLAKLISFKTVTGDRAEADALCAWVKETLQPAPVYVREYHYNGLPSLVITPTRRKHARLWLAAHYDVVTGPDEIFTARREGDRLIGRGAIDMKFAIACYLQLLRDIGVRLREYDLGLMLTPDEEWGGASSVKYLVGRGGYTGDVAFLPDGSGWWEFEESAKGMWGLAVCTEGKAAHGSKPWLGRSAITELTAFLTELQREATELFVHDDPQHWYTTMNVGQIHGGVAYNMIAPSAEATIDVRLASVRDRRILEKVVARLLKACPHTSYTVLRSEAPYGILRKNGYARTFARIAKEQAGVDCGWIRAHGSSDARFFNAADIPTLLIGPKGGGSHSDGEWVDVVDLERYYGILKSFVVEVAAKTVHK